MATVTLRGQMTNTCGNLPVIGTTAPEFTLLDQSLQCRSLADFSSQAKLIYTVPSLDTQVCAKSTRKLVEQLTSMTDPAADSTPVILLISADLPFAQQRFNKQYKLDKAVFLSLHRDSAFGRNYGLLINDGPLEGLLARALLVLDRNNIVCHTELVAEIGDEPDFSAALQVLTQLTQTTIA